MFPIGIFIFKLQRSLNFRGTLKIFTIPLATLQTQLTLLIKAYTDSDVYIGLAYMCTVSNKEILRIRNISLLSPCKASVIFFH